MHEHPKTPLTCAQVLAQLDDFIDRELSPEEMRHVQAHVELCAACAAGDRFERAWIERVRVKLRHIDLPPHLMSQITRRLAEAAREPTPPDSH